LARRRDDAEQVAASVSKWTYVETAGWRRSAIAAYFATVKPSRRDGAASHVHPLAHARSHPGESGGWKAADPRTRRSDVEPCLPGSSRFRHFQPLARDSEIGPECDHIFEETNRVGPVLLEQANVTEVEQGKYMVGFTA
jgi:hypothetical protein